MTVTDDDLSAWVGVMKRQLIKVIIGLVMVDIAAVLVVLAVAT